VSDIAGARILAVVGDSVDDRSHFPAGNIARKALPESIIVERGVQPVDFNSYGARRGNHEVMVRGTFAEREAAHLMVPGVEGA